MRGCGDRLRSRSEVLNLLNDEFPDRINPITKCAVAKIVRRFNETHGLKKAKEVGIGRRGDVDWPARSDLNPLDYFSWGHIQNLVNETNPIDVYNLQETILEKV
ncbi:hypothetical protein J6590_060972 [Homalodisca vitripennis]|nr:hypothetical protein J6590_060972 [Homalodisca vitripennis]